MHWHVLIFGIAVSASIGLSGCADEAGNEGGQGKVGDIDVKAEWHVLHKWDASEQFATPDVVALSRAIEDRNVADVRIALADGADVNSVGRSGVTPLFWCFPLDEFEIFELLLEEGADANVLLPTDFDLKGGFKQGQSVTHLAAGNRDVCYLKSVLAYGGDISLIDPYTNDSILHVVIGSLLFDKTERLIYLTDRGAPLNSTNNIDLTPMGYAVSMGGQFHNALLLLEKGADPHVVGKLYYRRLVHRIVINDERVRFLSAPLKDYRDRLLDALDKAGESPEVAREDLRRWKEWSLKYGSKTVREMVGKEQKARQISEDRE